MGTALCLLSASSFDHHPLLLTRCFDQAWVCKER
jgi:hypothetical protein